MKRISCIVAVMTYALPFLPLTSVSAQAKDLQIALLMPTQSTGYWARFLDAFRKEADARGVKVDLKGNNYSAQEQASQVDQTLAQRPDVIVLVPVDSSALVPSIRKIHQAGIPLVISNSQPDSKYANFWNVFTGPDDIGNGKTGAEAFVKGLDEKKLPHKGDIFIIEGILGTPPQIQRSEGFEARIKELAPEINIVGKMPGDWDAVKSEAVASALFTQHKNVLGVYAHDDDMMKGIITAAKRQGLDASKLVLVGHNCNPSGLMAINAGDQYATVGQSPFDDGAFALRAAADVAEGKADEKVRYLPHPAVSKSNISECWADGLND